MIWRAILDGYKLHVLDLDKAVEVANKTGYKFLNWNGDIYFITNSGYYENTGLTVEDINK